MASFYYTGAQEPWVTGGQHTGQIIEAAVGPRGIFGAVVALGGPGDLVI